MVAVSWGGDRCFVRQECFKASAWVWGHGPAAAAALVEAIAAPIKAFGEAVARFVEALATVFTRLT